MIIPTWQRIVGLLFYLIPWSDSLPFGRNLFLQFPLLQWLQLPAIPIILIERILPFGGLLLFLGIFFGIVRNPNAPQYLKFNALQALLLDILLILISYGNQIILAPFGQNLVIRTFSSTILVTILTIVIFAGIECAKGNEPDIPGISQAVRMQI